MRHDTDDTADCCTGCYSLDCFCCYCKVLARRRNKMRTITAVERMITLVLYFRNSANKISTKGVADNLHVSCDTARRYLVSLSASGLVPLVKDGKYWSRLQ